MIRVGELHGCDYACPAVVPAAGGDVGKGADRRVGAVRADEEASSDGLRSERGGGECEVGIGGEV